MNISFHNTWKLKSMLCLPYAPRTLWGFFFLLQCLTVTFSKWVCYFVESFSMSLFLYFPQLHAYILLEGLKWRKPLINVYWIEFDHLVNPLMSHMRTLNVIQWVLELKLKFGSFPNPPKCHTSSNYIGYEQRCDPVTKGYCVVCFRFLFIFYFPVFLFVICFVLF